MDVLLKNLRPLQRMLIPPPRRRLLSPVPRCLSFPLFRATGLKSIGIFTPRQLTFQRGTMRLFLLSPITMVTLSPSTNAPILLPFKFLILLQLFALSPRSLHPSFNGDTSFSLCWMPLLPLNLVVRRRLLFFPILLLGALLGVMTPPRSRLQQGHLLLPSPAMFLFLPPLVAPILTGLTALLLSPGEWGEWGVLAALVACHPPVGFSPQDLLSAWVSLLPPWLSIIASFISQVSFPRRFLRLSLAAVIIAHLQGGFVMLLHLLRTIIMRLHLWQLRLLLLLCRCVLCLKRISLLLWCRTLPCLSWLKATLLWRFHHPLLHLLLASLLLPLLHLLLASLLLPRLLRFLSWSYLHCGSSLAFRAF
jgi:hypothetical protein